jgi:hypothetical protein
MQTKMNKHIISATIGQLTRHARFHDWWQSDQIEIPFWNNWKLSVTFKDYEPRRDQTFVADADHALTNFLRLDIEDRNSTSKLAYANCLDFLNRIAFDPADEPLRNIVDQHDIWNFIRPTAVYASRHHDRQEQEMYVDNMYIELACDCDWERTHGLQLVFHQGQTLTRIGQHE